MEEYMADSKEQRIFNSKKYFLIKIYEYFENRHHVLQNKRCDSIRSLLRDVIYTRDELNGKNGHDERLIKSLKYLHEGIQFWYKENPLFEHEKLKRDFIILIDHLKKNEDTNMTCNYISSLLKKLDRDNIAGLHIDLLLQRETLPYAIIDKLLDSLVSDLIYEGYSLMYLTQWYKDNIQVKEITENNIDSVLNKFREIVCKDNKYNVMISCWLPPDLLKEVEETGKLNLNNYTYAKVLPNKLESIQDFIKFFPKGGNLLMVSEIEACDKYKAIERVKYIENYLETYRSLHSSNMGKRVIHPTCLLEDNTGMKSLPIDHSINGLTYNDIREKEDFRDFIELRENLRKKRISSTDIAILERALEIIRKSNSVTSETRFLNLWSVLEYLLTFYARNTIIERVRQIIPKVVCLYYVKEKMNVLWERLLPLKSKDSFTGTDLLFAECLDSDDNRKYNKSAFIAFLADQHKATTLHNALSENIIIQREIAELNMLLVRFNETRSIVENMHTIVAHDINRIYRIRNKLVHSGRDVPENIDIYSARLYRYLNHLVGTLIFYMKRTPNLTIEEILYSTVETYSWYMDYIKLADAKRDDIAVPRYLYL